MSTLRLSPYGIAREEFEAQRGREIPRASVIPEALANAAVERELGEEMLLLAWEIARCADGLDAPHRRALLALVFASMVSLHEGSTCLPADPARLETQLTALGASREDRACALRLLDRASPEHAASRAVLGGPGDFTPLVLDGARLYHHRMYQFEARLIERLASRRARGPMEPEGPRADLAVEAVLANPPVVRGKTVVLSDEQQRALRVALRAPLTVISGGPGTGKTSIVVSILRALVRIGIAPESIALAAPTGKAANRMDESIRAYLTAVQAPDLADAALRSRCPEARTLHRLLGYSPRDDRFRQHERNPLAASVVIVDEGSMIDLFLMERLLRAVRDDARLILLGDAEQLPSVAAGAVFRDLVSLGDEGSRAGGAVRLTRSYRMDPSDPAGRNILSVAQKINAGAVSELFARASANASEGEFVSERASATEVQFERVELLEAAAEPEARSAFLDRWFRERVCGLTDHGELVARVYRAEKSVFGADDVEAMRRLFRHAESYRILCLTREEGEGAGADAINAYLHRRALGALAGALRHAPTLCPGDPVMVQRNDYERGLFNGDVGVVLNVSENGAPQRFMAVFPRAEGFVAYPLESLRDEVRLAYAMTVHKSQGSEFAHVTVVLPDADMALLTREILYTAVTRAKKSVVVLGKRALLERGATRAIERYSGLSAARSE